MNIQEPPSVIAFHENCITRQGQIVFLNTMCQQVHWWMVQYWIQNLSGYFVLNAITTSTDRAHSNPLERKHKFNLFLAATKQLYEWFSPSVCPYVCLPVRHTFLTMFPSLYHHEIFRSYYQWQMWCPCQRSRSEVKGQGHRGQNPI